MGEAERYNIILDEYDSVKLIDIFSDTIGFVYEEDNHLFNIDDYEDEAGWVDAFTEDLGEILFSTNNRQIAEEELIKLIEEHNKLF